MEKQNQTISNQTEADVSTSESAASEAANLPTNASEAGEVERAKWSQAAREEYYAKHPENFAGPDMTYPIKDASDVSDAWDLAGHASDPDGVRAKIKKIAKRLGLESALPDTAKQDEGERSDMPDKKTETLVETTEGQEVSTESVERSALPSSLDLYLPIARIDQENRQVVLTATAERFDSYGTVIGFDASKEAFSQWRGNIREMHDPHKAVGRALEINPIPENKEIEVTLRVSKGAEDTWQKVLDGTLTGGSIGAKNAQWTRRNWEGKEVPFLERYDLVELSLVDNPSCPGCDIKLIRSDNLMSEVLDNSEAEQTSAPIQQVSAPEEERAGAPMSKANRAKLHALRDGAIEMCRATGCEECEGMMNPPKRSDQATDLGEIIKAEVERQIAPVIQRMQSILSQFSRASQPALTATLVTTEPALTREMVSEEIRSHVEASQLTLKAEMDKVLAQVGVVEGLARSIAEQPAPGGPLANLIPAEKRFAGAAAGAINSPANDIAAIQRASELGLFNDQQSQLAAATKLIQLQRSGA